ncbi:MAG: histidine kinase [Spirochaetaceae bacterium]|nr:MAG: histidine kinase [Spirochaetaceae bacterium]
MTEQRKNEFLSLSLAHAGELAYAEEAAGSYELLGHLNRFFRYVTHQADRVILKDEIRACQAYVSIQQISSPFSLTVDFEPTDETEEALVSRFAVIDVLDEYIESSSGMQPAGLALTLRLRREGPTVQCELYAQGKATPETVRALA